MKPSDQVLQMLESSKFTRRQRRDMGLTLVNLTRKAKQLKDAGVITDDDDARDVAIEIGDLLFADNPKAFADPQINWDDVLAFIEKLIPLILKIIALF